MRRGYVAVMKSWWWASVPIVLVSSVLVAGAVAAEDTFLGVSFGARALALGSAYNAVADDSQAILWNPAGLAQLDQASLGGSQNHLSFTMNAYSMTLNMPVGPAGVAGISVQQLNIDDIAMTRPVLDANGNPVLDPATNEPLVEITGFGQETDGTFLAGYGMRMGPRAFAGVAMKVLLGNSGGIMGKGLGLNAGALVLLPGQWRVAMVVEDFGTTTVRWRDGDRTILRPAGSWGVAWSPREKWLVAASVVSPLARADPRFGAGAEYAFTDFFLLRVGVDDMRLTGGAGFRMPLGANGSFASADYAFVTGGRYEDRNRLTLTVGF